MIISDKHQYLFIEIPLTASWAIRHELCEYYAGEPILHKHASYPEFIRSKIKNKSDYFVFASIRNPLDKAVSQYSKFRSDHKNVFSNPESIKSLIVEQTDLKKFSFIQKTNADFTSYFRKYHQRPYISMLDLSGDFLDFVIRFEHLQEDFSQVLQLLGLEKVRPIPTMNQTSGRKKDWESYYTPEIIPQAKKIFGPFMEKWGYNFPNSWGNNQVTSFDRWLFSISGTIRKIYFTRVRYSNSLPSNAVRYFRSIID